MTQLSGLDALRAEIAGRVIDESDPQYDTARSVWHGAVDHRPALIVRCAGPADVAAALAFARQRGLDISIRGGGHNPRGVAVADGGVVIDLCELRSVTVDPATRRAWCGGGATLAELDAATQRHGLAVPTGLISDIGVGGLTLGGGSGWLSHYAGLTADNLVAAQIVTADGRTRHISAEDEPDLFWALRGGGGNFGVVTAFEFRLHDVGPLVHLGLFFWGLDDGPAALRLGRDVLATLPRAAGWQLLAGVSAPPAEFVPAEFHGRVGYMLVVVGFAAAEEHARLAERIRGELPPLFEFCAPLPYTGLQQMFDGLGPSGTYAYEKNLYLEQLSDDLIADLAGHLPGRDCPTSFLRLLGLGGAIADVADEDTAFSGSRSSRLMLGMVALAPDAATYAAGQAWARTSWQALRAYGSGSRQYLNFMFDGDREQDVREAYGPRKYRRLARIKAQYDPENLFHHNANIEPARRVSIGPGRRGLEAVP